MAESITELKAEDNAKAGRDINKADCDIYTKGMLETRDKAELMTQEIKKLVAHQGLRNQTSSPGKQTILAKSIQNAYPMAGAAAFAAFGVMLMAAGPFGALMGIAIAYGAYAAYSAIKQHQEAQSEMQDQDGNEGEGAGRHNSGPEQSQKSQPSSASGNMTEPGPESGEGGSMLVAGDKQRVTSHDNVGTEDKSAENADDDEDAAAAERKRNASKQARLPATMQVAPASDAQEDAVSGTKAHAETMGTTAETSPAGASSASTAASPASATTSPRSAHPANAIAGASTTPAQPQPPSQPAT